MKKFLVVAMAVVFFAASQAVFAFVPLSNQQANLGSFRMDATAGMFYDELDIISAHPVSLLEFSGNRLYTTWGNVRNNVNVLYNPTLSYRGMTMAAADNTFVFGITGDPLSKFGISNSRMGFVFQNFGGKAAFTNLDNVAGNDFEGEWNDIVSADIDGLPDGSIDRVTNYSAKMKNYSDNAVNQFNVGFAKKGFILRDISGGLSISRQSNYTKRITGGTKSYNVRFLNDNGKPAQYPSGTTEGDTYTLSYADNEADQNSSDITDLLAQGRVELSRKLKVDVGVGVRFQNNYNPTNLLKNSITVTGKNDKVNNAGNNVVYDLGSAIRDATTLGILDYNDFANLNGDFTGANPLWLPAWAGGVNAPATVAFSDDRKGMGFLVRSEMVYEYEDMPITAVFNLALVPQKLDMSQKLVDYIKTNTYNTAVANDPLDSWVARDYTQEIKTSGDITNSNVDFGLKFDFIRTSYLNVAFGGFIRSNYQLVDSTIKTDSTEITSYDDGVTGNTPGTVALAVRPSAANGEGVWTQTISAQATQRNEQLQTIISVPVGAEIPITKKWTFRAGSQYVLTKTKTVTKTTAAKTTTTTTVTPAGAATQSVTAIADPAADYLNESVVYAEAHAINYTYGIEWRPNDNLTLACNAFLDTNPNIAGAKATLFDLDTYRLLAIQAVFKF